MTKIPLVYVFGLVPLTKAEAREIDAAITPAERQQLKWYAMALRQKMEAQLRRRD